MKSKVTFIIPYFGKLPNYFDLFLKSCKYNGGYRWIVFTDDKTIQGHTIEYANAAGSLEAQEICLKGAKGLAMTGYDILVDPDFQKNIRTYHEKQIPIFYKEK